jgi:hypothetical protein
LALGHFFFLNGSPPDAARDPVILQILENIG